MHEHQRPDREQYVHFVCENVRSECDVDCCNPPQSAPCCSDHQQFDTLNGSNLDISGPYDVNSVMHYPESAYSTWDRPTLVGVNGVKVPTSYSPLSLGDVQRICKLYPEQCPQYKECHTMGCPAICSSVTECEEDVICGDDDAPECCNAIKVNADCSKRKSRCFSGGCGFMSP